MIDDINLRILVSNIVAEKHYSHCRLCLGYIKDQYVRFTDTVSLNRESETFEPVNKIVTKLLGHNVCDEIPGIDAVCISCVDKVLEAFRFIETCAKSTQLINKVINNLSNALNIDVDESKKGQALYIIVEENESKLLWTKKQDKKRTNQSKQAPIECYMCSKSFGSYIDLKAHNLINHETFTCDKCYEAFTSESKLTLHESTVHKLKCPECPQYRNTVEALEEHITRVHTIVICGECGKTCQGKDKLKIHEEKHNTKFVCPKCGKRYATKDFYLKHVKLCLDDLIDPHPIRSSIKKDYTCEKCAKAYSTPGGLRVHNRFAHGNAKPHVCKECGKQFTAPSYLRHHMIKHTGEKNFICDLCGSRFVSKEALLYHTRRHTGEKPYSCKYCNERFVNASARAEHIKFKHIGPTLMCEICSRKFVTSYFLKQHISRHHDPSSKLYYGRNMIPPNMPGEQNMRTFKIGSEK
ncbi:zinc finger protein 431-like [Battus philenor]|uniref:zinc finger protein 431-like n=1 Tax=Battus philenor TaxID=42288 RepID=UPI0035CF68B0